MKLRNRKTQHSKESNVRRDAGSTNSSLTAAPVATPSEPGSQDENSSRLDSGSKSQSPIPLPVANSERNQSLILTTGAYAAIADVLRESVSQVFDMQRYGDWI